MICMASRRDVSLKVMMIASIMSTDLPIYVSMHLSTHLCIYLPIYASIFPSMHLTIHLCIYPYIHLSIYRSIHRSIFPSIHLSIHLCIYPQILGNIAVAVRASCTFPGMFQPVMIDGIGSCIDGGVWDHAGLMAMPDAIKASSTLSSTLSSTSSSATARDDHDQSSGRNGSSSSSSSSSSSEGGGGTVTLIDDDHQVIGRVDRDRDDADDDVIDKADIHDVDQGDEDVNHGNSSSTVTSLIEVSKTAEMPSTNHHHHHHHHHHPLKKLVVNIIFGRSFISTSKLPVELSSHKVHIYTVWRYDNYVDIYILHGGMITMLTYIYCMVI